MSVDVPQAMPSDDDLRPAVLRAMDTVVGRKAVLAKAMEILKGKANPTQVLKIFDEEMAMVAERMPKCLDLVEVALTADLLQLAADHFGNHACNDYNLGEVIPITQKRRELMKKFHTWNGDPENFDPENEYVYVQNSMMMAYMAFVIGRP